MKVLPLILDTNLLLLFVVGATAREYIAKHKRLNAFIESDYDTLLKIMEKAPAVLVTPYTLTETSNLCAYIAEPARSQIFQVLQKIIESSEEKYLTSLSAVRQPEFVRLGLTDAALLDATFDQASLLTTDLHLYLAASKKGYSVTNFNHIRDTYL